MKTIHDHLLRAVPYQVGKTFIKLPTLEQVFSMGIDSYLERLYAIVMDYDPIRANEFFQGETAYSDYDIFVMLLLSDEKFKARFFEGLELFTSDRFILTEDIILSIRKQLPDGRIVRISEEGEGELVPHEPLVESFWNEIRKVLCLAHWIPVPKETPQLTGKAAEIAAKLRANKEEVARLKSKSQKGESIEVYELISSFCACSPSYNLFNVWGLTYYQFFDQLKRIQLKEEYEYSLEQILAGVDPKKLEIRHWTSSIQTQN